MGKSRVKGIVVEIGGDTMGLDKALKGTNENIYKTQSQLKDVERLLKLDPKNTVLLGQKQRLLAQSIEETKGKLAQLNETHDQAIGNLGNYDAWAHANDEIQDEIDETRDALRKLEKQKTKMDEAGEVDTDEYKQLTAEIEKTSEEVKQLKKHAEDVRKEFGNPLSPEQFDSLQREIVETQLALQKMEQSGKVSFDAISDKAGKVADAFAPVTKAVAALGTAVVATVPATEELREKLSMLDANAAEHAVNVDHARAAWKKFAVQSGDTGSAVEAVSNLLQAGFTESNLQRAVENLAGAAVRFPDTLKVESLADSLQETLATGAATGQFAELLERLGLSVDEFNAGMAGLSSNESVSEIADLTQKLGLSVDGLVTATNALNPEHSKEFFAAAGIEVDEFNTNMAETSDMAARQNYILQTLADAGLNDSYLAWKQNNEEMLANREASLKLEQSTAKIAETILPTVANATSAIAAFLDWLAELPGGAQVAIAAFLGLAASISPIASTVSNVMGILDKLSGVSLPGLGGALGKISGTALPGLGSAFSSVASFVAAHPIVWLIAAVASLVVFIATSGDEIQHGLGNLNTFLKDVFAKDWAEVFGPVLGGLLNNFLDMVESVWDYLYTTFDGVIDFIRGLFTLDLQRALDGVVKIFKAPINNIISMINNAIDGINWLIEGANKLPGVSIGTIGQIPMLANGGEVLRGSAIVGEGGPELLTVLNDRTVVQPLTTNNVYHNRSFGSPIVNVYGAPGQDVRELAQIVMEEMQGIVDSEEAGL